MINMEMGSAMYTVAKWSVWQNPNLAKWKKKNKKTVSQPVINV